MISGRATERLRRGDPLIGWFAPAGSNKDLAGVLRWSDEDGARLELLDATTDWPRDLAETHFTVRGYLREEGEVSMLSCLVRRRDSFRQEVLAVNSPGLAVGEITTLKERWSRAVFATHNLDHWRPHTGMAFSYPNRRARPHHFRMDWQPPASDRFPVKGAVLNFGTDFDGPITRDTPTWHVETHQTVGVEPLKPFTIEQARRSYGLPLLALTAFAVNRPDAVTKEVYLDRERRRRAEVWWSGEQRNLSAWRPGRDRVLFYADELPDFTRSVRRWWRMHEKVWPALGTFGDHILEGSTYSPARFLTLYTAVETYSRERHGHKDLRKLRQYGAAPSEITGCTNRALALVGASRKYFAHRGDPGQAFSTTEIEQGAFDSTRRLEALLQACLLRDIGFRRKRTAALLEAHYANWPIPIF